MGLIRRRIPRYSFSLPRSIEIPVELGFPSEVSFDTIAATGVQHTTEKTIALEIPSRSSLLKASLLALITAENHTANTQEIDITVQGRKGSGSWNSYASGDAIIGLPNVLGATSGIPLHSNIDALVTKIPATYGFRLELEQSASNAVNYSVFFIIILAFGSSISQGGAINPAELESISSAFSKISRGWH